MPAANRRYWNRIGRVEIEAPDGTWERFCDSDTALDFKFNGEKVGSIYTKFTVSIRGISASRICDLATWDIPLSFKRMRGIRVYAGYEFSGEPPLLFSGFIVTASPTPPPDLWIEFSCMMNLKANQPPEKVEMFEGPYIEHLERIASGLGMKARWDVKKVSEKYPLYMSYTESASGMVKKFSDYTGLFVYEEGGVLVATDSKQWFSEPHDSKEVSIETGMLEIAEVDMSGATVKMRLNDAFGLCSWIRIKSVLMPKANGDYFVLKKKHVGHLRGNDWYTLLKTIRHVKK